MKPASHVGAQNQTQSRRGAHKGGGPSTPQFAAFQKPHLRNLMSDFSCVPDVSWAGVYTRQEPPSFLEAKERVAINYHPSLLGPPGDLVDRYSRCEKPPMELREFTGKCWNHHTDKLKISIGRGIWRALTSNLQQGRKMSLNQTARAPYCARGFTRARATRLFGSQDFLGSIRGATSSTMGKQAA